MANYHILKKSPDNRYAEVYVHLPIPASKNTAGTVLNDDTMTYQWAVRESLGSTISVIPNITPAEQTALDNGELYEYHISFRFSNQELTNSQRRTEVENGNDNMVGVSQLLTDIATPGTEIWNEVLEPLEWWGYFRNVGG